MILAPTLSASAGSGAAIARPTFSRDFAGEKTLNNGAGPAITFTRASNATFFDANGVLRLAPHNLLLHSEDFENAAWAKELGATVTANTSAAPDGSVTADTITFTTTNSNRVQQTAGTAVNGETLTFSVWLKGTGTVSILLDTSTGVGGSSEQVATLSSTWTRYTRTVTYSSPTGSRRAAVIWRTGNTATSVNVWGAQLVTGSQAGEYFRTTNAAASMPRFDHSSTGSSLGLLIEEARTNLLVRSAEIDNASWTKSGGTITANSDTAPDGTTTADKFVESNANETHQIFQTVTGVAAIQTASFFVKAAGRTSCQFLAFNATDGSVGRVNVDLTNGTTSSVIGTATSTSVGNGWYRVAVTYTPTVTNTSFNVFPREGGSTSYAGNGTDGILIWGAQLEAGAFPTSYIPTTSAAATRSADSAVVTPISSFYNQSEGTLFAEHRVGGASGINGVFMADNGDVGTRVALFRSTIQVAISGVYTSIRTLSPSANTTAKVALAYSAQNHAGTIDGASVSTNSSIGVPSGINTLRIGVEAYGTSQLNGHIRKIAYYPKRLSNTLLQQLTT